MRYALAAVMAVAALAAPACAADLSAKLVPADAPFYAAWLRNREQVELVLNSRAFAELKALPSVQMVLQLAQAQAGASPEDVQKKIDESPFKDTLALALEAVSDEIFLYGGDGWADLLDLIQRLNTSRYAPLFAQMSGKAQGADPGKLQAAAVLSVIKDNVNLIKVPNLVLGFKVKDVRRAQQQVVLLEKLLAGAAEQKAELKGRVGRAKVGGGDFVTLTLDEKLIPWDQIPVQDFEEKPGDMAPVMTKLKSLKVTISVGVRDGYLLLGIGESTAPLAKLGGPGQHLTDLPEFAPLAKQAGRRLTSVAYSSKAIRTRLEATGKDIEDMLELVRTSVPPDALTAAQRQRMEKDLKELARDIKGAIPERGAALSFTFLTPTGQEGYAYDWSKHPQVDGSKPLTLLNHVGGSPILAAVGRSKQQSEGYATLAKWVKAGWIYVEELVPARLGDDEKKEFATWTKALKPLARRLDEVTGTMLVPSLADGQAALVLDAKWTAKAWFPAQPPAAKPLPMLEFAGLLGVSDAALFEKAMVEYRKVASDFVAKLRELKPGEVPEFQIPKPRVKTTEAGKLYTWPLPGEWGVDKRIAPTAGLTPRVGVFALSEGHVERLLKATPLKGESKILTASAGRPLAGAVVFDWPGFVDAVAPWVEYGVTEAMKNQAGGDEAEGAKAAAPILAQARTVMNVLKACRGFASVSYFEEGALVTHFETIYRDLPAKAGR